MARSFTANAALPHVKLPLTYSRQPQLHAPSSAAPASHPSGQHATTQTGHGLLTGSDAELVLKGVNGLFTPGVLKINRRRVYCVLIRVYIHCLVIVALDCMPFRPLTTRSRGVRRDACSALLSTRHVCYSVALFRVGGSTNAHVYTMLWLLYAWLLDGAPPECRLHHRHQHANSHCLCQAALPTCWLQLGGAPCHNVAL